MTELQAEAYKYVGSVKDTADGLNGPSPWWYGWALREAFEAGAKWRAIKAHEDAISEARWTELTTGSNRHMA